MENSKKTVLLVVIAVVVIFAAAALFLKGAPSGTAVKTPAAGTESKLAVLKTEDRKAEIMKLVNSGAKLTEAQKQDIFKVISGSQINEYAFTPAEKTEIVKALNR